MIQIYHIQLGLKRNGAGVYMLSLDAFSVPDFDAKSQVNGAFRVIKDSTKRERICQINGFILFPYRIL
jgi:hypothetical protein